MAHKVKLREKIIRTEIREKDGATYKYELIMAESERFASFRLPLYSIAIEMTVGDNSTRSRSRELFSDAGQAIVFFEKLVRCLATPMNLRYVVEDEMN